ncbi:MAG: FAD-dependent oxidoreductase [Chloroflexota bacterium]
MQSSARVIIVGAGIVGCSIAYHLAKLGWKDIVVLDKGPLYETGGSSSHAPGLLYQLNYSKFMTQCAMYTINLYDSLRFRGEQCFYQVGGMEVAATDERMAEFQRKETAAIAYGLESYQLSPQEVVDLIPIMDVNAIKGGYYVPTDGDTRGWYTAGAMAEEAIAMGGAHFYGDVEVQEVLVENGKVTGVATAQGNIKADQVLLATNVWTNALVAKLGMRFPIMGAQHLYMITEPLPELAEDKDLFIKHPMLRHQDFSMYYRQHGDAYGLGNYRHESLLVPANTIGAKAEGPFTPEHYHEGKDATDKLFPCVKDVPYQKAFNGYMPFTHDGMPIMGETSINGLLCCLGVWVTHAGGVGKTMAEWMDSGTSEYAMHQADSMRLQPHSASRTWMLPRIAQQYQEVHDIIHPHAPVIKPRNIRVAPYHQRLVEQQGHFHPVADWEMADWYDANEHLLEEYGDRVPERSGWEAQYWSRIQGAEHLALRDKVGLYNLANFAKFEVHGAGALAFLENLAANRINKPVGSIIYTTMCDAGGGVKTDLTITRTGEERFLVLAGGGTGLADLRWMANHMPTDGSVVIEDQSSTHTGIGLWGPLAREVLASVVDEDVSNEAFPYFTAQRIHIGSVPVHAARLSYTGELGWELYCPNEFGLNLWDTLWEAGQDHGIFALGRGAFNSLRVEKGYRALGSDLTTDYNPYEAGLGWAVRLKKGDFIGREALRGVKKAGINKKLCCITSDAPSAMGLGGEPIVTVGTQEALGYFTSVDYGYSVGKLVGYAYLPLSHSEIGTEVEVLYFDQRFKAVVSSDPQVDPKMERLKA